MGIFLNKLIQFYLHNTINLRYSTQRIKSCYTHKMAYRDKGLCDVTSPYVLNKFNAASQSGYMACQR